MALINIEYGSLASSDTLNKNFNYLAEEISDTATAINTSISSIISNIATINLRLADLSEEIDAAIETCSDNLQNGLTEHSEGFSQKLNNLSMLPDWIKCSEVSIASSYEAESNGYLLIIPNSTGSLTINSVDIVLNEKEGQLLTLPLRAGDIVTCTMEVAHAYFIPAITLSTGSI